MRVLLTILFLALTANAELSFQTVLGDASGLKAILDVWKAEILARDGNLEQFWPHGITVCDFDGDTDPDILVGMHSNAGGSIFLNQFAQTGQVTFLDGTYGYIASRQAMPHGDSKYRCYDADKNGTNDVIGASDESVSIGYFNDPGGLTLMDNTFGRAPAGLKLNKDELSGIEDITGDGYLDVIRWNVCPVAPEHIYDPAQRKYIERPSTYARPIFPPVVEAQIFDECTTKPTASHVSAYEYDLNGDALLPDIVLSGFEYYNNQSPKWMYVLMKQADGSYVDETAARGFIGDSAVSMVADLSGDGRVDFMLFRGTQAGYYKSQPDGTWLRELGHCGSGTGSDTLEYYLGQALANGGMISQGSPTQVRAIDFDFDGDLDTVLHNTNPTGRLRVCENNGALPMRKVIDTATRAWRGGGMDLADMNDDCKIDIVHGHPDPLNHSTTSITIYLNTSPGEPPPCEEIAEVPLPPPPDPLVIQTETLPVAVPDQEYFAEINVTGGVGPYQTEIEFGNLPPGLMFRNGVIDGSAELLFPVLVRATDSLGVTVDKVVTIPMQCTVAIADAPPGDRLVPERYWLEIRQYIRYLERRERELWDALARR